MAVNTTWNIDFDCGYSAVSATCPTAVMRVAHPGAVHR